jgi:hypothetical protein
MPGSSWVVAWYTCDACSHYWSARLRNGRPVPDEPPVIPGASAVRAHAR